MFVWCFRTSIELSVTHNIFERDKKIAVIYKIFY